MLPIATRALAPMTRYGGGMIRQQKASLVVAAATSSTTHNLLLSFFTQRPTSLFNHHRSTRVWLSSTTTDGEPKTVVDSCREKIEKALETEQVVVKGAFDDPNGTHIAIEVISTLFEGKRPVQRQQMVYKALWEELKDPGGRVHAVDSMTCKTPDEIGSY